jgi:hypothetical protein
MILNKRKSEKVNIIEEKTIIIGRTKFTMRIADKNIRGKTRDECIAAVNKMGKFKFTYHGLESVSEIKYP